MTRSALSKRWWVHFPNDAYSMTFDLDEPMTEREFRAYLREWEGVDRLPNRIAILPELDQSYDRDETGVEMQERGL